MNAAARQDQKQKLNGVAVVAVALIVFAGLLVWFRYKRRKE